MKNPLKTVVVPEERAEEVTRSPNIANINACEEDTPLRDELRLWTKIKTKVLRPFLDVDFEMIQLDDNLMRLVRIGVDLPA